MTYLPERDFVGYGRSRPEPRWPGGARLALSVVLNYEEGGEPCVADGDAAGETILSEVGGLQPLRGRRHLNVEQCYEYGARVGAWRCLRVLEEREVPLTVYAVGSALERNPAFAEHVGLRGHEVAAHGWRWIDYMDVDEATEAEHLRLCVAAIERLTGRRPLGWYTGRESLATRRLVAAEGGFLYDSDAYNDDLPYWLEVDGRPHLVIPHALDTNDSRCARGQGFDTGDHWLSYMRDAFDWLYAEGAEQPAMMTVSLHGRLIGRPGRIGALARFLDHVRKHPGVWICQRADIARHWRAYHPPRGAPAL